MCWIQGWCHEDNDIGWILASRSLIWRDEYDMINEKNDDGVLVWNSNKPCSSLCFKPWRIKILSVWFQEKNSTYGSKSRSWWTHVLSPSWLRLWACKQVNNSLCISRYCDRAWRRLSDGQSGVQGVIQRMVMWELSLWRSVSWRNEDCVSIHAYLQEIIIMKSRRKYTRLIKTKYKDWIQVDQLTKHIWCTKWDQVILWYGKQLPIVLCELTHDICVWCFYMWLGIFTWACIKRKEFM